MNDHHGSIDRPPLVACLETASTVQPSSHALQGWTSALAKGDEAAWRWLHEHYYLSLLRYAAHRCGDASAATEIVQDAYLRIARHAKPFVSESDFWGWLCCIVRCVASDYRRHIRRRSLLMEKYAHWRASRSDDGAEWHPSTKHALALINDALAKLPDEDGALLRGKYWEGRTTDELATALGTTSKTVEHRLARLRKQLREIILRIQ